MKKDTVSKIVLGVFLLLPRLAYAGEFVSGNTAADIIKQITGWVQALIAAIVIVNVAMNIFKLVTNVGEADSHVKAIKNSIISGVILEVIAVIVNSVSSYF